MKPLIPQDPRLILNLYFVEFARLNHPLFRDELYNRIRKSVLTNSDLEDIYGMIKDVIIRGIENNVKINEEVFKFVNHGSIYWRKYYRRGDCQEQNDIILEKGVEDLVPPNKGHRVMPVMRLLGAEKMPKTTGELEELRLLLRKAGVPRCSNNPATQSLLDWIWNGYVSFDLNISSI